MHSLELSPMICVIDAESTTAKCISYAIDSLGYSSITATGTPTSANATHYILAGSTSVERTINYLKRNGVTDILREALQANTPILTSHTGMGALFKIINERTTIDGAGLIQGDVSPLKTKNYRNIHIGWNQVNWQQDHPVLNNIDPAAHFYFQHSLQCQPTNLGMVRGVSDHDGQFISCIAHHSLFACQFWLERSGLAGLHLLKNFCEWDGVC